MASIKLKAAQQTARVQRSFNGAYSKQSSPADEDWDMPDMYDMQQSVTKGWSAVRQAVVNNAPTSFPTAFSNSSATSAATSSYGRQPLAPAKNAQEKPKHVETGSAGSSLWGKITDAVNQGWDTHVTNRDEIDDFEVDSAGDTHLIRVMKEYHSAKAKTPSDLPAWLFPPEQRSVLHAWEEEPPTSRRPQRGNASSLDDVFSSEPTKTHYTRRNYHRQDSQDSGYESGASSFSGSSIPPQQALGSRAATRLQSLRREGRPKVSNQTMEDEGAALFDKMPNTRSPPSMKRAGLPSRPQMKGSYDRI